LAGGIVNLLYGGTRSQVPDHGVDKRFHNRTIITTPGWASRVSNLLD
jgi:hypothetical protein